MLWKQSTFFLAVTAGWMNHRQQEVIECLREENRVLREKLGRKRVLLTVEQKRRLAIKGKTIGGKLLQRFGTLFSLDTIPKSHLLYPHARGANVSGS